MTAAAVVPGEQLLALAHMEGHFLVFAARAALVFHGSGRPWRVGCERDRLTIFIQHGIAAKRPIFPLAAREQQHKQERYREFALHGRGLTTVCTGSARGTRKSARIASISWRLRTRTASMSCRNASSSRRTPIAIAKVIGRGPSIAGWTGVTRSGGTCSPAK